MLPSSGAQFAILRKTNPVSADELFVLGLGSMKFLGIMLHAVVGHFEKRLNHVGGHAWQYQMSEYAMNHRRLQMNLPLYIQAWYGRPVPHS